MDQLRKLFTSLSVAQRISILAAMLCVLGGLSWFSRWRTESDFRLLFNNVAPEDAGAIVQKLKESGAEYRLGENGTAIMVPSAKQAELRLSLAAAGLPKAGRVGFELFDKANFGATEFVEHINFRRALEGELERSVTSLAEVEQARVHITFPKDSIFLEAKESAKASVLIKLRAGASLAPQSAMAICHLISSAVDGLVPEAVSVIDMQGHLLSKPKKHLHGDVMDDGDEFIEVRQRMERDLVAKVNSTLEPLLGESKFRVGASIDCDFSSGEQSEETFDPDKSVMATSQKTEDGSGIGSVPGTGIASGVPGTPSSLPRPVSKPSIGAGVNTRRTENVTYQTSRTVKKIHLPQGTVKRVSLSILLDQGVRWQGKERVLVPPSPEMMKTIRDVVAGVAGFDEDRGDQLVVETLPFESTLNQEQPVIPSAKTDSKQKPDEFLFGTTKQQRLIGGSALATLFVVGMVVFVAMRNKKLRAKATRMPAIDPASGASPAMTPAVLATTAAGIQMISQPEAGLSRTAQIEVLVSQAAQSLNGDGSLQAAIVRRWLTTGVREPALMEGRRN
jgi:flagellar M-ring protein FliF